MTRVTCSEPINAQRSERREQGFNSEAEIIGWRDEAEDEIAAGREVVEVARVDDDVMVAEEAHGEVFVRMFSGDAEDGVPACVRVEEFASGLGAE